MPAAAASRPVRRAERARVGDLARAARLVAKLPPLLRRPLTLPEARAALRRRHEARQADFLALVRRALRAGPRSPYPRLLAAAGCEYGDVERLVARDGVEAALAQLAGGGVCLTADEARGRRPVVRGGRVFEVDPAGLASPAAAHVLYATSGSRGAPTIVSADVAHFRDRAVDTGLCLEARGGRGWRHALWIVPGGAALTVLLQHALLGAPPVAWFSQVDPRSPGLDPRYAWTARALRWAARAAGASLPRPLAAPLDRPDPVLGWMRASLRAGPPPHLVTFPSSAVALCGAARGAGVELAGARLSIGGEPVTPARLAAIRAAGAEALPHYGSMEAGRIGEGCLAPEAADDVHVLDDLHALVQAGPTGAGGMPPGALLISSLRPSSPVVLLNVSLGDQAVLARRRCGCPLEALGWTTHLHTIRSYEKLTAAGMTVPDAEAVAALEEALPARFGGSPADYQLVEEEDAAGRPRLVLVVAPRVGPLDPEAVAAAFLDRLAGPGAARIAGRLWREAGLLRVERRAPRAGASGKVLHRHLEPAAPGRAPR